ncbi:MAG: phosphoglycerate dehydrogenase [Chloroflexi bacterium]|nr:phosphoglycerate dehydrogenase [Chloroflexota bacterium]
MTAKPPTRVMITPPMLVEYPAALAPLRDAGCEVVVNTGAYPMSADQLAACLKGATAAVVGLDDLAASVFAACPELRLVARNGVGLDNVDLDAANQHGVLITAPFGANSTSVAELAMGLLIALVRQVIPTHNRVQAGVWQRVPGMELAGKTLGIIGLGRIGKKVARRAQAFNMRVIANDIYPDLYFAREHTIPMLGFETVLAESDIISLHVPLTPLTYHMLNRTTLTQMKQGAYLLNTARGAVLDGLALAEALDSGHLAGAALDVHPVEGVVEAALLNRPNVLTTTHLGAYTHDALQYTTEVAVQSILQYLNGQRPSGLVNPEVWDRRYADR